MNRHRNPIKYTLVTAAIIGILGVLTFGGVGARAVREASSYFGGQIGAEGTATLQTCGAAVKAAFDDYAATLTPIAQQSVSANAPIVVSAETALTDGVAAAPCPPEIESVRQAFVTQNRLYITTLQDIADGSRTTADQAYREAQSAANQAWDALLVALRIGQ